MCPSVPDALPSFVITKAGVSLASAKERGGVSQFRFEFDRFGTRLVAVDPPGPWFVVTNGRCCSTYRPRSMDSRGSIQGYPEVDLV